MIIVTSNTGKYNGIIPALKYSYVLEKPANDIVEIQSADREEIIKNKARQAFAQIKKACIVDDFGIIFDEYPKFPGAMTKYVLATLEIKGIKDLLSVSGNNRAIIYCDTAYIDETEKIFMASAEVSGFLDFSREINFKGNAGVLSSIFVSDRNEYPVISHRIIALKRLENILEKNL